MSIIVPRKDIPDNCMSCSFNINTTGNICCEITDGKIGTTVACYERMKYCPLKSIDGLIENINTYLFDNEFGIEYRNDIATIIKEYCGGG